MHNKSTTNRTSEVRSQHAIVRRLFAFDSAFRFYRKHITEDRRTTLRFQRCRATVKAGITSEIGAYPFPAYIDKFIYYTLKVLMVFVFV